MQARNPFMKNLIHCLYIALFVEVSFGQISFSGDAQLRYGESKNRFGYSETIVNTNLQFGNFFNWSQFEFSDPPEIGRSFSGLRNIRLDYQKGPIRLGIGDIYEIWGRGLVLNQVDDQAVDLNNKLTGLTFVYQTDRFRGQFLGGKTDIWKMKGFDTRVPSYKVHHNVFGSDAEVYVKNATLGFSFLQSRENHPITFNQFFMPDTIELVHRLHGVRFEYFSTFFDIYSEYADKNTLNKYNVGIDQLDSLVNRGRGFYGNINLYPGAWSFSIDYKNYNYINLAPDVRWDFVDNYGGVIDFQQSPIGIREHSTRLLSRIIHQVDFNNEVGYQIETVGSIKDWFTLLIHYARSSRTNIWEQPEEYQWTKKSYKGFLPHSDPAGNPFEELYLEEEGYNFSNRLHHRVGIGYTKDIPDVSWNIVTDSTKIIRYELIEAITIPTSFEYVFSNGWSFEIKAEYQKLKKGYWVYEEKNDEILVDSLVSVFNDDEDKPEDFQINTFFSLGIGKSPNWSLSLIIDGISVEEQGATDGKNVINPLEDILGKIINIDNKWISLEFVYNITPTHRLSLMYGSQQGGLLCSNGICRTIEPFDDGFKLTLTSLF